ncbi:MAG: MGH1-like glycoside hydrolase domain-containing protein [Prolixibacteraceae bacterium]
MMNDFFNIMINMEYTRRKFITQSVARSVGMSLTPVLLRAANQDEPAILNMKLLQNYVDYFNKNDIEYYKNFYPNKLAYSFLSENIPLFECPDKEREKIYYFRWWIYRKHIRKTKMGYVVTEFLPDVSQKSSYGVINCPAGHYFREGRWLHNNEIMIDYMNFYLNYPEESSAHKYSFWSADSILAITNVHPNNDWLKKMLNPFIQLYQGWNNISVKKVYRAGPDELWARFDHNDGIEWTVCGHVLSGGKEWVKKVLSVRPTFNSYMYGDSLAISQIACLARKNHIAEVYENEAALLKKRIQKRLWNEKLRFFIILPKDYTNSSRSADVREQVGFIPWYFNLPDDNNRYDEARKQLMDTEGFYAPFGPTTCEQRYPFFTVDYNNLSACQWNGPSWPCATSQTLTALANLLNNYNQQKIGKKELFETLKIYTRSHAFREIPPDSDENRKPIVKENLPWIDENLILIPETGWPGIALMREKSGQKIITTVLIAILL